MDVIRNVCAQKWTLQNKLTLALSWTCSIKAEEYPALHTGAVIAYSCLVFVSMNFKEFLRTY